MNYETFLDSLTGELNELAAGGMLRREAFLDGSWNQCSWLHARIHSAMVRAVRPPSYPMLEVKWNREFRPDLCLVNELDKPIAVIEYESTNSSDERLIGKDLRHFEAAILEYHGFERDLPKWWLILSTLPDGGVKKWPWQGWNKLLDHPPLLKSKSERDLNPYLYYAASLHKEFAATAARIRTSSECLDNTSLIWANVNCHAITVLNIDGERTSAGPTFALSIE